MRTENWCGYDIRFIEIDGEWCAILKDICDALGLRTDKVAYRLESNMLQRVLVDVSDHPSKGIRSIFYDEKTGKLMQSITVQGGDVEQLSFED